MVGEDVNESLLSRHVLECSVPDQRGLLLEDRRSFPSDLGTLWHLNAFTSYFFVFLISPSKDFDFFFIV